MMLPTRICNSSTAATTRKYLPTFRWLSVNGRTREDRVHRRVVRMVEPELVNKQNPAKARKVKQKLAQVQTKVLLVGVFPTSGS